VDRGGLTLYFFFLFGLWQENHPPILGMFEKLMKAAKGKQVAVFLDYDGTLSPIVEDPDKAYMAPDVRL
jgi:trehalose 6-phosphate phosphatase